MRNKRIIADLAPRNRAELKKLRSSSACGVRVLVPKRGSKLSQRKPLAAPERLADLREQRRVRECPMEQRRNSIFILRGSRYCARRGNGSEIIEQCLSSCRARKLGELRPIVGINRKRRLLQPFLVADA